MSESQKFLRLLERKHTVSQARALSLQGDTASQYSGEAGPYADQYNIPEIPNAARAGEARTGFLRTVLNAPLTYSSDPISVNILGREQAEDIFNLIFVRLNPYINLFDPILHTVDFVRSTCPFLFTTLIMVGSKFFAPDLYQRCYKLAFDFAAQAFIDGWKTVEVVQAFMCLAYWNDSTDDVSTLDHMLDIYSHCL